MGFVDIDRSEHHRFKTFQKPVYADHFVVLNTEKSGELVSANAGNELALVFPNQMLEPQTKVGQHVVADMVATGVVDLLEPVEIDADHG